MISKTLGTLMLTACLSTSVMAQVAETPPSQTSPGYVNEEEKERFEKVIASLISKGIIQKQLSDIPFEQLSARPISGSILPMNPSNYTDPKECEKDAQYLEWDRAYREDPLKNDTLAWQNMYRYVRAMNVLEKQDCSCATRNPPSGPAIDLVNTQPVSKLTGNIINTDFFYKLNNKAYALAKTFCGGHL